MVESGRVSASIIAGRAENDGGRTRVDFKKPLVERVICSGITYSRSCWCKHQNRLELRWLLELHCGRHQGKSAPLPARGGSQHEFNYVW